MKNIVLKFGLISGAISSLFLFATVPFRDQIGFDKGMYFAYTSMLLAFLLVFFGVRSYRENVSHGHIGFFKAWGVGLLIMVLSITCYVIAWEIVYFNFLPDFIEKYSAYTIEKMRNSGKTAQEIAATAEQMKQFKAWYANPLLNALITFAEPLPVGLIVSLASALILRKRQPLNPVNQAPVTVAN